VSGDVLVWWRDDDAGRIDVRLNWLLALAAERGRTLGLAVVPAWLDAETLQLLRSAPQVEILQHGWAHVDHAASGEKSIELGGTADPTECLVDVQRGAVRLEATFGDRFLRVMVPPWNRIDEACLCALAAHGFHGISTYANDARGASHALLHVNTHIDLIDWRGTRRMKPLAQLFDELEARLAQPDCRVVGLLSHHLNMSLDDIARLRQLLCHIDRIGRCRWTSPADLFMPA
jgi:peptidoglycan/xylan/chitin deacetylase (PgdA/CDA1 family)